MWQTVVVVLEFFIANVLKIYRVLKTEKHFNFFTQVVKSYLIFLNLVA